MKVHIAVDAPTVLDDLCHLQRWLCEDDALRAADIERPVPMPEPGTMGAVADILVVTLGSSGLGAALASALSVWLRSRVGEVHLTLSTSRGDLTVDAKSVGNLAAFTQSVRSLVDDSGVGAP